MTVHRQTSKSAQVKALCEAVQDATSDTVRIAWADQDYTAEDAKADVQAGSVELRVFKLLVAKKGFMLLPRRWVVGR